MSWSYQTLRCEFCCVKINANHWPYILTDRLFSCSTSVERVLLVQKDASDEPVPHA